MKKMNSDSGGEGWFDEIKHYDRLMQDPSAVFVFGSNQAGVHGAGAARKARDVYGAKVGVGVGTTGRCYAIPTKDRNLRTLDIRTIEYYVDLFLQSASEHPDRKYVVTRVGCGLAGYGDDEIAPLFVNATPNVIMHPEWHETIGRLKNNYGEDE